LVPWNPTSARGRKNHDHPRFRSISIDGYPNLRAYLQRIGQRFAYQRAMAKVEPGMARY
jgi:hypothetical protein